MCHFIGCAPQVCALPPQTPRRIQSQCGHVSLQRLDTEQRPGVDYALMTYHLKAPTNQGRVKSGELGISRQSMAAANQMCFEKP